MPKIYGFISQKGGTMKSTEARGVGVSYARAGWKVIICDFDLGQATSTDWALRRAENGFLPAIETRQFRDVATALRETQDYDLVILDGLPHGSSTAADIATVADMVVIPTGPCVDDLKPTVMMAYHLRDQLGIDPARIVFSIGRTTDSVKEVADARAYLESTGFFVGPGHLKTKASYVMAHDLGLAVNEARSFGPKQAAKQVIQGLVARFTELTQ